MSPICLAPEAWPEPERTAWRRALMPRQGLYGEGGAAAGRPESTIVNVAEGVGHWLAFLVSEGALEPVETPLARITPARLDAFVTRLRQRGNAARSIAGWIGGLCSGLRWMQPGCDVGFIRRPRGVPISRALGVEAKVVSTVDSLDLYAWAAALSEAGMARLHSRVGRAAVRDGALLGLLALFAPRVGELAATKLRDHLYEEGASFRLHLPGSITKTGRGRGFVLPEPLAGLMRRYLEHVRPHWQPSSGDPHLWLSLRRRALNRKVIQEIVANRVEAWTGERRRPHWFRKCLTTTAALRGASFAYDTALVMGHSPTVALRHYNMATAVEAADRHAERLRRMRDETRALAMRFYDEQRSGTRR
ncbi:hypothetical protein [Falsiroseomonas sp. E2-1-a20]|uniref:hypothetical protein n=1 Tax=Falsiroseomonas sp. E2-1-a20 TaxID=3239300 RepID=UPI003F2A5C36